MTTGAIIGLCLGLGIPLSLVIGAIAGFYFATKYFKKQLKKNPPITEAQIRAMYAQMGRKPTEAQIKQVMAAFRKNQK